MKKTLFFSVLAAVLLSVGIGAILYANSQKTTFSPTTLSPEKERVFEFIPNDARYDPECNKCIAYVYKIPFGGTDGNQGAAYTYHVSTSFPEDSNAILIESREGELMDCVECQYRCSAYYELCDEYGVEYY